jgi:hypothetical protein
MVRRGKPDRHMRWPSQLVATAAEDRLAGQSRRSAEWRMKMLDKNEQSDRAPNPNEKPESCYCSALPKGFRPVYDDGWDDSFVIDTDAPSFSRLCQAKL